MILPIVLCIVLFSPCSTYDKNAEIVDAAVRALKTASTGSDDTLLALSLLGPQAALLMNATVPIGAILGETAKLEPQSEEYRVLMDLRNRTEEIWKDNEKRIGNASRGVGAEITSSQYLMNVNLPIRIMKRRTNNYIDPRNCKYNTADETAIDDPLPILDYCNGAVTPTDAEALAYHRDYFMRVLLRLKVDNDPIPDLGLYLSEFLYLKQQFRKDVLHEDLDVFKHYFSSYRRAIEGLFEELRNRGSIYELESYEEVCLLRAIINKSYFNYPAIKAFVVELKNQLIDLTFIAGICANVSQHGQDILIDKYAKEVVDAVTLISSYTSKWLNDSLISAWPSAHNEILNEEIMRTVLKPGYADNRNLKTMADLTQPLLINTGMPNNVYEMLIVRTAEEYEIHFDGISDYCSLNKQVFGFDTVIARIPLNSKNQRETFNVEGRMFRLSDYAYDLNITIQYEMGEIYDAANLPLIADSLKKNIVTEHDFHCWAIVREWSPAFWSSCPTIHYWSSSYNFVDLSSITTLSYMNRGMPFQHCEVFRFFLFA